MLLRPLVFATVVFCVPLAAALPCSALRHHAHSTRPRAIPAWLLPRPGTLVRVDSAPWFDSDEPEAALTASAASLHQDFTSDGTRPDDIVYEPVGVRARIVRVAAHGIVLLHGTNHHWTAFAPLTRLVPDVPPGTALVVAGGFGGFADFYPSLGTTEQHAGRIATGTHLVALSTDVAAPDPGSANRLRVHVRVTSGPLHSTSGWLEVPYTGLAERTLAASASTAEHACSCRLLSFAS